jgi:hypothetical protein
MTSENEYYTPEEIQAKIVIRPMTHDWAKIIFSRAVSYAPKPIIEKILSESVFIVLDPSERAFYLSKQIINGRNVFVFPATIYEESEHDRTYAVLHEVAHSYLEHHPIDGQRNEVWENKADLLAKEWMRKK